MSIHDLINSHLNPIYATLDTATTGTILRPWDVGDDVIELQELLKAFGFKLAVTGEYDSRTEDCVMIFQRRHGFRVDAVIGPKTWAALKLGVKPGSRVLRKGLSGVDVYELQGLLNINGYEIARDGFFEDQTYEAVMEFQQQHKLRETGMCDRIMWAMLQNRDR
ncbi:MAG: peptidoglycan-binding protein [Leptolyngbya sp.]|nr:MAG: peptidoglycan-binding protein [Leptolyngbya sp.]